MKIVVALGLAFCLVCGAGAVQADDTLQGTWELVSGEADGKPMSDAQLRDGKLVIDGDHYTVVLPDKKNITGEQKLNAKADPKTIDITDDSGANKGKTCLGIYELKGDRFRVAFGPPGKTRPTKMTTTADSGYWVHVWKRVKK